MHTIHCITWFSYVTARTIWCQFEAHDNPIILNDLQHSIPNDYVGLNHNVPNVISSLSTNNYLMLMYLEMSSQLLYCEIMITRLSISWKKVNIVFSSLLAVHSEHQKYKRQGWRIAYDTWANAYNTIIVFLVPKGKCRNGTTNAI
jgi:hypothetical protein